MRVYRNIIYLFPNYYDWLKKTPGLSYFLKGNTVDIELAKKRLLATFAAFITTLAIRHIIILEHK